MIKEQLESIEKQIEAESRESLALTERPISEEPDIDEPEPSIIRKLK